MANSSGGIINKLVGPAKNDTERDARTVAAAFALELVIGSVFAISWQPHYWAVACMWASACALVGMLLGFLFGIPRFLSRSGMTATIPATDKQLEAGGPAAATVTLTEPATGATVSGKTVTLTATAGTGLRVASAQFKVDGSNVGAALTASPYTTTLDSTTLSEGAHSITAAVTDSAGNTSTSTAVSIIVGNTTTAVSVVAPAVGATVSGKTVTLTATATAGTGLTVASVQFKVDGSNVGAALTASPYTTTLDSTTLLDGAHSITAAVTDSAGNTSASAAVSVTVNNTTTAVSVAPPTAVQRTLGGVNTNLEEISDWLTKIIVGVGLVELQKAQSKLQEAAGLIAQALGGASQTSFAYALMVYFSIVGFFGGYLITRLYLQRAFGDAASGR
jgi:hypothetical protein